MIELSLKTNLRNEFINVSDEVQAALGQSNVKDGLCLVYCPHTTAAVTINEGADTAVARDLFSKLSELAPEGKAYEHREGNADAHIKRQIMGREVVVAITNGRLDGSALLTKIFGPWEQILGAAVSAGPGVQWAAQETSVGQNHWGVTRSHGGNGWT